MTNSHLQTLKCLSCGSPNMECENSNEYVCGHCGTRHVASFGDNGIMLTPILEKVVDSTSRMAEELAIQRIQKHIKEELQSKKSGLSSQRASLIDQCDRLIAQKAVPLDRRYETPYETLASFIFFIVCFLYLMFLWKFIPHIVVVISPILLFSFFMGKRNVALERAKWRDAQDVYQKQINDLEIKILGVEKSLKDVEEEINAKKTELERRIKAVSMY